MTPEQINLVQDSFNKVAPIAERDLKRYNSEQIFVLNAYR